MAEKGAAHRSRRGRRAADAAFREAMGRYKGELAPHRARYAGSIGRIEEQAKVPYQESAAKFFEPIRAEHEESLSRAIPSIRAGQAARGQLTSGGGAAQESEMYRRAALNLSTMRSGTEREERSRIDALNQYLVGEASPYEMMGVQIPMQELGFQQGQIENRYGSPRGQEVFGQGLAGAGQSAVQLAMLNALYGGGGVTRGDVPLDSEYAWGQGGGGGGYQPRYNTTRFY